MRKITKYGQHFLADKNIADKIVSAIKENFNNDGSLVEIGPGKGFLTFQLIDAGFKDFTIVEIDEKMVSFLSKNLPRNASINIVHKNFLDYIPTDKKITFAGNLPYITASKIIHKAINLENFYAGVFMVQREQATRFKAQVGDKEYGSLSILTQLKADVKSVCRVSKGCFSPPPKVESEVLLFTRRKDAENLFISTAKQQEFEYFIKQIFCYKRKTILNVLSQILKKNKAEISSILKRAEILEDFRPQNISILEYVKLFNLIRSL
ncbi:MAG: ribosomal RNA small subunit methyltransferase A [Elusimicrobiaceae bacterium]|jgi:16S rRNA (adenine1518-N6/adenine1519-N6)-dimethyltransferase|nr:ribosomal RNA small subunit methyltransferase A [Elusimicrobiaceae bacterium]MBT3955148.1 ribosomal RNA small subunit methyltransferase A [Elusimicrobiaceae bacterium]MBT4008004.1 ribosomal RNA small subunit methyltransferase A [Elusimicrobiaceae bacterium]MBT4402913.1 ribosomal RNA small subunit methyltransferase A [Elusimicrobiaceae bacterium]MBT4439481.1 ribosomal RNA small subunit methyltransferase A [Elusimicrobiaceae bacterium]